MAHENIQLSTPNFCLSAQAGTIGNIDTTNPITLLKIKELGGTSITDYTLSSNIVSPLLGVEYVGPIDISGMLDNLTFITCEKINSTRCTFKFWETNTTTSYLDLKRTITKYSTGNFYFDVVSFAVEYYRRAFTVANEGTFAYLEMTDVENVDSGTQLFLGPSTDTDNLGASEKVVVSHVGAILGGYRVYLTSIPNYQYAVDDPITFYSHLYVFSGIGYGGDVDTGSVMKIDAYTGNIEEFTNKSIYKRFTSSKWCPAIKGVGAVCDTNLMFVSPYNSYQNWRSMWMANIEDDKITPYTVYDVIFDGNSVYKLSTKVTLKDDTGNHTTYDWGSFYNYQEDTLVPYTSSLAIWLEKSYVIGDYDTTNIEFQVRDQYFVGLRDTTINGYKSGDADANFDPLSGLVTSDINGRATLIYAAGHSYDGLVDITARAAGSSTSTGSQYVWNETDIVSVMLSDDNNIKLFQKLELEIDTQLLSQRVTTGTSEKSLWTKSFFITPGGDWLPDIQSVTYIMEPKDWKVWLPQYWRVGMEHGPNIAIIGNTFSNWPYAPADPKPIPNQIRQVDVFSSEAFMKNVTDFLIYREGAPDEYPYIYIKQPEFAFDLQLSQLKLSKHTHWVDSVAYDYLWTDIEIDQFIFISDAVPAFWSEKNPTETNIWLRMRPFAFSLDGASLEFLVREISFAGDTGWQDVSSQVGIEYFDAGGGILGLEVLYNPTVNFHHNALVRVRMTIADTAPSVPNVMTIEYWFLVIADYVAPYITNLDPARGQVNVPVDQEISFELKDEGTGVDIDNFEMLVNSRLVSPNITRVNDKHYMISYTPYDNLLYEKEYIVSVKANDTSEEVNRLNDAYRFYTAESDGVILTDFVPGGCVYEKDRYHDVSFVALAGGNGIDGETLRIQVFQQDVTDRSKITPIIYRVS